MRLKLCGLALAALTFWSIALLLLLDDGPTTLDVPTVHPNYDGLNSVLDMPTVHPKHDESEEPQCLGRLSAQELLRSGKVSVAFPILGVNAVHWQRPKPPAKDNGLFVVEAVYKAGWRRQKVQQVNSTSATFVVSKQYLTDRMNDFRLCTRYPHHQVLNHLASMQQITVKSNLAQTMKRYSRTHPAQSNKIHRLVPASFQLSDPLDCKELRRHVHSRMWILKEDLRHNSMGVRLLNSSEAQSLSKSCGEVRGRNSQKKIVQQYLSEPLLVAGRKCDFRVYLYIPVTVPLLGFYAPAWYMKCGHQKFNVSSQDLANVVTNTKVGGKMRKGANYSELVLGPAQLQAQLTAQGFAPDWVASVLGPQIKSKLRLLMEVVKAEVPLPEVGYELLGCDMMLDSDLNIWLIEVNASPQLEASLGGRKAAVDAIVPQVVGTQMDLLRFAASGQPRLSLNPRADLPSRGSLELIYHNTVL